MKKMDKILKILSDLYEFNRKIKAYAFKKEANNLLQPMPSPPRSSGTAELHRCARDVKSNLAQLNGNGKMRL